MKSQTETQFDDELALVPVPRKLLPDVYALLSARMTAAEAEPRGHISEVEGQGPWEEPMVRRLQSQLRLKGLLAVLDACARAPGTDVAMLDVASAIDMPPKQLAAQMGSLSKLTKKLFDGRITWPVSVRYQDGGQAIYSMNKTVAGWWLRSDQADTSHQDTVNR
jgi:hypothetical protein